MEYIMQLHNRAEKMLHFIIYGVGERHMSVGLSSQNELYCCVHLARRPEI